MFRRYSLPNCAALRKDQYVVVNMSYDHPDCLSLKLNGVQIVAAHRSSSAASVSWPSHRPTHAFVIQTERKVPTMSRAHQYL